MNEQWLVHQPTFESDALNPGLAGSPWSGHRYFAYDLIRFMKPETVAELGTHYGCSLFAFCQAAKDFGMPVHIYAVDTWQGDEHAGYYGEEVFEIVTRTKDAFFANVSVNLLRKLFDEALDEVADGSVDLLHIDGLHTYEAVAHDFRTWLPKLKENGIVLFHDIASYTGYGSAAFWEELKQQHPHFDFQHSWGLGVLFPKGSKWHDLMREQNFADKLQIYTHMSELALARLQVRDLTAMADERFAAIEKQSGMIRERDEVIASQARLLEERYEAMRQMEQMIIQRDEAIAGQAQLLEARYASMQEMEAMIRERDDVIAGQAALAEERFAAMQEMGEIIVQRDRLLEELQVRADEAKRRLQEELNKPLWKKLTGR